MLLDAAALQKSSEIDPTVLEFAKANPQPPLDWTNADAAAAFIKTVEEMQAAQIGPAEAAISESYREIPMSDGTQSTIKIHRPTSPPAGGSPLIVLSFGGGWISGSREQLTANARGFVRLFGAVVVSFGYRLAPQHKFPTGQQDCWDSLKWVASHAAELGADPSKGFIAGGVSAGGNCTAVISTKAVEDKLSPPLTGQWLCVPAILDEPHVPAKYKEYYRSREQNQHAPVIDAVAMEAFKTHTRWEMDSPMRFPTLSPAPLSGIPPTFFMVCGMDPLRDDALVYDEMLKDAGVKTRVSFYPGCPHSHWAFMPGLEVSNRALADINTGMGWLLGRNVSVEDALKAYAPAASS